jgi:tetratricopeptide (TPR) repeat protein
VYIRPRRPTSRRRGVSLGRLLIWLFAPVLILAAAGIYTMRDEVRIMIAPIFDSVAKQAADTVATIGAPTPQPTQDPSSNRRLAEAAWANGQYQEAVRLYEEILPALPNDVSAHYYYTLGLVMQGRIDEAVAAAENAVTANPFSSDAWAIRAMALNREERLTDSIVSAMRAVELNPDSARARAFLAESFADLGRASRAEQEIERALELDPDSYEAHYVNGLYQWQVAFDFGAARVALEEAYALSNGAAHVGLRLAELMLFAFGDDPAVQETALGILTDILDRNPDNASVLYRLGYYWWRTQGDNERGETYLRRCVAAVPTDQNCNYELGRTLWIIGQLDEARQAFERAIDVGSINPYYYWWAGRAQMQTSGDCAAAMRYFQPGYQILQDELAVGSAFFATIEALEALVSDYQEQMTPCMGGQAFPTPESTAEPTIPPDA